MRLLSCATVLAVLLAAAPAPGQTKDDVPDLIKLLKDPDVYARLKAAKSLGKVAGGAREAIPALTEASAHDGDLDVRVVARNALDAIKLASVKELPESAAEALKVLRKSVKAAERAKALEDVAALGPDGREASAELIDIMMGGPPGAFQPFLDTLEKINPVLQKPLVTLLVDKDTAKRGLALDELQKLGDEAEPAAPVLLAVYKVDRGTPYKDGQSLCPKLIATMGKVAPRHKQVGAAVMGVFTSASPNDRAARAAAIEVAAAMDLEPKHFVSFLTAALADPPTRLKAVVALRKLGPAAKSTLPMLAKLKLDSDAAVREAAAKAIDDIKGVAK